MNIRLLAVLLAVFSTFVAIPASAVLVQVDITGEVEYNQINGGILGAANAGDSASVSFLLDTDNFIDSGTFPTRGYVMDPLSFALSFAGGPAIGLQNPSSPSDTPQFILRDNDPAVDGFFMGNNVDGFNNGVALDQAGLFDAFRLNFLITYGDDPLSSLNVFDAIGSYDFTGLTVFNMTIDDGPFNAMGMVFDQMTIQGVAEVPEPGTLALLLAGLIGFTLLRKVRSS